MTAVFDSEDVVRFIDIFGGSYLTIYTRKRIKDLYGKKRPTLRDVLMSINECNVMIDVIDVFGEAKALALMKELRPPGAYVPSRRALKRAAAKAFADLRVTRGNMTWEEAREYYDLDKRRSIHAKSPASP